MDIVEDIHPIACFRTHAAEVMRHLKTTGRPVMLTVDGKAALVVRDAGAYRRLLDLAAQASIPAAIRLGPGNLKNNRTRPAPAVFDAFRAEHDIPR